MGFGFPFVRPEFESKDVWCPVGEKILKTQFERSDMHPKRRCVKRLLVDDSCLNGDTKTFVVPLDDENESLIWFRVMNRIKNPYRADRFFVVDLEDFIPWLESVCVWA